MAQITINSTVEELKAYVESAEYEAIDWRERDPIDNTIVVALAKNGYSFDLSYGRSAVDDIVFEMVVDMSFKQDFDEGSRWSNFVTDYAKFTVDGEDYYVALSWEQAATEMQEHGSADVYLVKPVEKTIISYEKI